jgi:hypothetical protein
MKNYERLRDIALLIADIDDLICLCNGGEWTIADRRFVRSSLHNIEDELKGLANELEENK